MENNKGQLPDEVKKKSTLTFDVKTAVGELSCSYYFRAAEDYFHAFFNDALVDKKTNTVNGWGWMLSVAHALDTLKEIMPQILTDALNQAVREAREATFRDLDNTPVFLRQKTFHPTTRTFLHDCVRSLHFLYLPTLTYQKELSKLRRLPHGTLSEG